MQDSIKLSVLRKLPPGLIVGHKITKNMDRNDVEVIVIQPTSLFRDRAMFDINTGEYIGEDWEDG